MNYQEAMDFIHSGYKFGMILGLDNITLLLEYLGNPQDDLKFIHLAGTNGKGSTSAMLASVLKNCGYKTGLYISPYLERFGERIQIDNVEIPDDDLVDATMIVKEACDRMVAEGHQHPTEFEVVTAIAMVYYKKQQVDIIVLEVGLGGRLDATNVISSAEVAVITSISFDHMAYLGNTLKEIAYEKAGIIKENNDVSIYALNDKEVIDEIKRNAEERHARVYVNDPDDIKLLDTSIDGLKIKYLKQDSNLGIDEFVLPMIGDYQVYNALNALTVLEILKDKGWNITTEAVLKGLETVRFTGRFEIMHRDPIIVIDGGHNIEGITSFVNNIKRYFPDKKVILFYGMLNDKQVDESVNLLTTIAKEFFTLTPSDPRAVPAEEMTAFIHENFPDMPSHALQSIGEIKDHVDMNKTDEIYAFTGSLYMIGSARTELTKLINQSKN